MEKRDEHKQVQKEVPYGTTIVTVVFIVFVIFIVLWLIWMYRRPG
jgi:hypothetical protein